MGRLETPALIARKRDGGELSPAELRALVEGYLAGDVAEAQMAALLMAGVIRGFTPAEAVALTEIYVDSGARVDLSRLPGPTVDKHSTGGVGDTATLVIAPIVAACGLQVAKLSGRGLGHTGGTLDKLEAIPGLRVDLTRHELVDQVERVGMAVAAATADLVPADKRLYALRDVTGTVPSPALIAASVMSKKLAGGAEHIVLDVKCGDGAFMADLDAARALADLCIGIGTAHGRATAALITDMSQPLGDAVGNALEVRAAVEVLQGGGDRRLRTLGLRLAASCLERTGRDRASAERAVADVLDDQRALEVFREFVVAQGGDPRVVDDPRNSLPTAPVRREWHAPAGTIQRIGCRRLGELAARLGAGRLAPDDTIDPAVGLEVHGRVGDRVNGAPTVTVHARSEADAEAVVAELGSVFVVEERDARPVPLVLDERGW